MISELALNDFGLAMSPSFFEGNWYYNLASLVVAVVGFGITIWQLYKTRRAADAARESARLTVSGFHRLAALVNFSELERWARDIIQAIEYDDLGSAKLRLLDLRSGLARARESSRTEAMPNKEGWQDLITAVVEVHELISASSRDAQTSTSKVARCQKTMFNVYQQLSAMAAKAAARIEPKPEH